MSRTRVVSRCDGLSPAYRSNIAPLEADLDAPVVTSFQAMLWHVFDMLNLPEPVTGYGRIFQTLQR